MHLSIFFFFFNHTATTEIYTLSLHDALPISRLSGRQLHEQLHRPDELHLPQLRRVRCRRDSCRRRPGRATERDRKSTRLNSSHVEISYAVFCLKKKKTRESDHTRHEA